MPERPQNKHLRPCKPGETHNPNGRPKSIIRRLEELVGQEFKIELTREDRLKLLQWMLDRPKQEIQQIANDPKSPAFLVNIAAAISKDIKDGKIVTMDSLLDRCFGSKHRVEIGGVDGKPIEIKDAGLSELIEWSERMSRPAKSKNADKE